MSGLFHEAVLGEFIDRVFAVMALSPQYTFQVLTKRPERMQAYLSLGIFRGTSVGGRRLAKAAIEVGATEVDASVVVGRIVA